MKEALTNAFERIENDWVEMARKSFHAGFPETAYVGSCSLVSVVHGNKVYVANAGDSKAAVYR